MSYYHGGAPGFKRGDHLLPPSVTRVASPHVRQLDEIGKQYPYKPDRVYMVGRLDVAWFYAVTHAYRTDGPGAVYKVESIGLVETDTDQPETVACSKALIQSVPYREVLFTQRNKRLAVEIITKFSGGVISAWPE